MLGSISSLIVSPLLARSARGISPLPFSRDIQRLPLALVNSRVHITKQNTLTRHRRSPEERPDVGAAARRVERCAGRQGSGRRERRRCDRVVSSCSSSCSCSAKDARVRQHAIERAAPVDASQRGGRGGQGLFGGGVCCLVGVLEMSVGVRKKKVVAGEDSVPSLSLPFQSLKTRDFARPNRFPRTPLGDIRGRAHGKVVDRRRGRERRAG